MAYVDQKLLKLYNKKPPKELQSLRTNDISGAEVKKSIRFRSDDAEEKYLRIGLSSNETKTMVNHSEISRKNLDHFARVMANFPDILDNYNRIVAEKSFLKNLSSSDREDSRVPIDYETSNKIYGDFREKGLSQEQIFREFDKATKMPNKHQNDKINRKMSNNLSSFDNSHCDYDNRGGMNKINGNQHLEQDFNQKKDQTSATNYRRRDPRIQESIIVDEFYSSNGLGNPYINQNQYGEMNKNTHSQGQLLNKQTDQYSERYTHNLPGPVDARSRFIEARGRHSVNPIEDYRLRANLCNEYRPLMNSINGYKQYHALEEKNQFMEHQIGCTDLRKDRTKQHKSDLSNGNPFSIKIPYKSVDVDDVKGVFDRLEISHQSSTKRREYSPETKHSSYYERSYDNKQGI